MSVFSVSQNEEKENNRQKALTEKRRKVKLFGETVDSITERYNLIVETINAPSDYKFLDGIEILKRLIFFLIFIIYTISVFRVENEHNATHGIAKKHHKKEKRYKGNITMNCSGKV